MKINKLMKNNKLTSMYLRIGVLMTKLMKLSILDRENLLKGIKHQ